MSFGIARPELLPVLAVPLLVGALLVLALVRRRRALAAFGGPGPSLVSASPVRQLLRLALLVVAVAAIAIAMVGPQIGDAPRRAAARAADVVIALDVSQSMAVRDVAPDRLRVAQRAIEVLGQQLAGSRVGLVLFAGGSVQRYPLTTDTKVLGPALDTSGRGYRISPGSSLRAALLAGQSVFPAGPLDDRRAKAIVLITDGEDPAAQLPPLEPLRQRNIHLFALGVGTVAGGPVPVYDTKGQLIQMLRTATGDEITSHLDEQRLRELTDQGGGRYWHYEGDATAREVADTLRALDPGTTPQEGGVSPEDRYQIFLALGVAALIAEWLIDERRRMPRPKVPSYRRGGRMPFGTVVGASLLALIACGSDPLVAQVDEANAQFARGDVRAALTKYRDLQLQRPGVPELAVNVGNALQELGDLARSLTSYQQALDGAKEKTRSAAYYDRGNALFHLGRLDDARAAYVDALKVDPTDHDAKFNIEVIDKLLAQLRPQQQQNPQGQPQQQPPGPGQSQQPQTGQQGQQGQPQQGGQPQGGPPPNDNRAGASPPPTVQQALTNFRQDLGLEEALRLLDALRGEQRGVEGFIEGQGTRRGNSVEVPY